MMGSESPPWQQRASLKRASAFAKIPAAWRLPAKYTTLNSPTSTKSVLHVPRECGILSQLDLEITENYDAVGLSAEIGNGRYSALMVAEAFCKRAAIADQLVGRILLALRSQIIKWLHKHS